MKPYLSIVIPAYNEADRINKTILSIEGHFKNENQPYEIIVVDDGSTDRTYELLESMKKGGSLIKIIKLEKNSGKGAAVKEGMLSAYGEIRLFMDADSSTSIVEIEKLIPFIINGNDIVIGSRIIKGSVKKVKQSYAREFLGWVYRVLVHSLININVKDTQNGFKLFSKKAVEGIFPFIKTKGWSFDLEVLALAQKNNYNVKEVPIVWSNDHRSKMTFIQMIRMLWDLILIRLNLSI